ncbi:hypothetical protein CAPTEDRAFT_199785 [Capitella teleta]|uniref:Uncharacterized protein n=1 Tax=Capitella teleta TaxID=283909 RepID=R7V087_CAPTE|nr:hypothetical protein CAPTEDRAFT_199785 [Capitella teleta]|eukprot:ELU12243.1 hypothetical protein CAPTEDRAFT_199785 [Capitella teleta]
MLAIDRTLTGTTSCPAFAWSSDYTRHLLDFLHKKFALQISSIQLLHPNSSADGDDEDLAEAPSHQEAEHPVQQGLPSHSLPDQLELRALTPEGTCCSGVWATAHLGPGAVFGPLQGKLRKSIEENSSALESRVGNADSRIIAQRQTCRHINRTVLSWRRYSVSSAWRSGY